ncbi:MAG: ribosome-associated translation inhibitor RaiA [Ruminococcaceae bacterium]|nr:ribosome-associated translation inhibitor RaiA [Oscillospiraceae bacterium]MBQ2757572.1 ribosome-associated translation inhibitor RaiA [Clostridia bacterium]
MKITMSGKQMSVRSSLKELTEKKLARFDRFFGEDAEAAVVFSCRHGLQYVEITIYYGGTIFRCEEGADTFQTAIDEALEALERQIRKNKTRLEKRLRPAAFDPAPGDVEEAEEGEFQIRTKYIPVKPMSVEEAILQMNLLEHQFFVFRDAQTEKPSVVYRRKDGNYGLITEE